MEDFDVVLIIDEKPRIGLVVAVVVFVSIRKVWGRIAARGERSKVRQSAKFANRESKKWHQENCRSLPLGT